jgi:hypothetical protein
MTIKHQGGIFGRNPTFNNVDVDGVLTVDTITEKTGASGVTLDGVTLKDGNVVLANGYGIDFSATSGTGTSELFDDYEEGVFSPIYEAATSNPSVTYDTTIRFGYYTKIGRTVFISCAIRTDAVASTGSGSLLLGGLPYAGGGGAANRASFYIGQSSGFNSGYHAMSATLKDNQTQLNLYTAGSADPRDGINQGVDAASALINSANKNELLINGFYTVV